MAENNGKPGLAYLICWGWVYLLIDLPIQLTPGWSMIWSGYDRSPEAIALVVAQTLAVGLCNTLIFGTICLGISLAVFLGLSSIGTGRWANLCVVLVNLIICAMMLNLFIYTDPSQLLPGALAPMAATLSSSGLLLSQMRKRQRHECNR